MKPKSIQEIISLIDIILSCNDDDICRSDYPAQFVRELLKRELENELLPGQNEERDAHSNQEEKTLEAFKGLLKEKPELAKQALKDLECKYGDSIYEESSGKGKEFELRLCEKCIQMTNHLDGICQKCKIQSPGKEGEEWREKYETAVQQKINLQKELDRLRDKYEPKGFANEYRGA